MEVGLDPQSATFPECSIPQCDSIENFIELDYCYNALGEGCCLSGEVSCYAFNHADIQGIERQKTLISGCATVEMRLKGGERTQFLYPLKLGNQMQETQRQLEYIHFEHLAVHILLQKDLDPSCEINHPWYTEGMRNNEIETVILNLDISLRGAQPPSDILIISQCQLPRSEDSPIFYEARLRATSPSPWPSNPPPLQITMTDITFGEDSPYECSHLLPTACLVTKPISYHQFSRACALVDNKVIAYFPESDTRVCNFFVSMVLQGSVQALVTHLPSLDSTAVLIEIDSTNSPLADQTHQLELGLVRFRMQSQADIDCKFQVYDIGDTSTLALQHISNWTSQYSPVIDNIELLHSQREIVFSAFRVPLMPRFLLVSLSGAPYRCGGAFHSMVLEEAVTAHNMLLIIDHATLRIASSTWLLLMCVFFKTVFSIVFALFGTTRDFR
eukprot:Gregarina_sp_Poly_1__983@NODE_123_length_13493_cov_176_815135_g110_i0_p5_GENE_NODE_123_length_13493_cov_176_815135_g110_i0NODE_123_length_13493_cov_176_815135_g110_i0_p5_ORF_typecomplete_len444_score34_53_NODE_123_length_13493_cov_176_815135_g110_i050156346